MGGMGVLLLRETSKCVRSYRIVSERVVLVNFRGQPMDINIIQEYAPTAAAEEEDLDDFYDGTEIFNERLKSQNEEWS